MHNFAHLASLNFSKAVKMNCKKRKPEEHANAVTSDAVSLTDKREMKKRKTSHSAISGSYLLYAYFVICLEMPNIL